MKLGMCVMSWYYHAVGIFFGRVGTYFGISFLQTEASLKKARGSERERATFECETIYVVPLEFIYKGNIELHECPVKFWNYSGFGWPYLHIN